MDELRPYLETMGVNLDIVDFLYEQAQTVININGKEEEDDDEGELLCDCEFTLAYGTKILLHNRICLDSQAKMARHDTRKNHTADDKQQRQIEGKPQKRR